MVELKEDNYYFKLGAQQQWLIDYIEANPAFIPPDYRRNEVLGFLKNNTLEDLCISRPAARLNWGIPMPFDPEFCHLRLVRRAGELHFHSRRAWRHAASRQSQSEIELWPADIHVIGKDILKFHAVYWPIMLKAMGLPLPKQILSHGWWQKDGAKISKSTGNIVDPIAVIDEWGLDAFRFYVLRELDIGPDGNWTDAGFKSRYSSELANGLGNLVNRSLSMLKRYRKGIVPAKSNELSADAQSVVSETNELLEQNQLQAALQSIWSLVTRANQYVDQTAPFKLAKDPAQAKRLDEVLYNLAETCRVLAVLLWPFLPETAVKIYAQLGLNEIAGKIFRSGLGQIQSGHKIGEPAPLFPRKGHLMADILKRAVIL